jgi:hypothetical protein
MAYNTLPTNRQEFKQHILRKLGAPVIEIELDDDQIEDRIDEAIQYWNDYHFDGALKTYFVHQITVDDITNRSLQMPEGTIGALRIFPLGTSFGLGDMFNIRYQIALNDLYTLTSVSMVPYYMTMSHLAMLQELLVGQQPVRYNRHENVLHIDMDWNTASVGDYIVVESYVATDLDVNPKAWSDRWLLRYASALCEQQWGKNISKYSGGKLMGAIEFNGEKILERATREREALELEMNVSFSLPCSDQIG